MFESIRGFKDAEELAEKCTGLAEEIRKNKAEEIAIFKEEQKAFSDIRENDREDEMAAWIRKDEEEKALPIIVIMVLVCFFFLILRSFSN